jgi:hypothetical protein
VVSDNLSTLQLLQQSDSSVPTDRVMIDEDIVRVSQKVADFTQRPNLVLLKIRVLRIHPGLVTVFFQNAAHTENIIPDSISRL